MLKQSRILAITAAALAMTIGAANAATPAAPDAPPPGGPGMAMGGHGGHRMEMRMQQQLNELHGQLKLNADQEKLWQTALDTMKQNHAAMRESHKQMRQQFEVDAAAADSGPERDARGASEDRAAERAVARADVHRVAQLL